jgi:ketosteroid isomerase-like protein
MAPISTEDVQRAFDAAVAGDLDRLVTVFDPELDWRGLERGHLWWRNAPARHGRKEARSVLQQRRQVVAPGVSPDAEVVWTSANAFVVRLQWRPGDGPEAAEGFQVLRIRGDRIREIGDYRIVGEATKAAKQFAVETGD